jgi:hypothetical protein
VKVAVISRGAQVLSDAKADVEVQPHFRVASFHELLARLDADLP